MRTKKMAIAGLLSSVLIAPAHLVWAQSDQSGIVQKGQNPYAEKAGYDPYSTAHLKIDVLEAQLGLLRKNLQLQANKKAHETEEWDKHYETVKKHIEDWDRFQGSYGIE